MQISLGNNLSPQKISSNPSSLQQFSDSGSPQSGTQQSCNNQILTINQRLNKFMISSEKLLKNTSNISDIQSAINQLILLSEKINFLRNNNRQYDHKLEMLCYYNISCGYQMLTFNSNRSNFLEECLKYLRKSIDILKVIIPKQQNLYFKLKNLTIRMNLQYCALLSQIQSHNKAIQVSVQALIEMKNVLNKGYEVCSQNVQKLKVSSDEKISFTQNVLKKAKQFIEKLKDFQSFEQIIKANAQQQQVFKKLKEKSYFWESNFENNQKILRKQFTQQSIQKFNNLQGFYSKSQNYQKTDHIPNRNILGLKISNQWITSFTIGKIMHMVPLNYLEYCEEDNILFQFSYRNLIQKVFLTSAIYFSVATQMRFLQGIPQKKKKVNLSIGIDQQMKKSEILHMKAIETVFKHIKQSSTFTDHLINSYHRHYNPELATIQQQPSFAEYSLVSTYSLRKIPKIEPLKIQKNIYSKQYDESCTLQIVKDKKKQTPLMLFTKNRKQKNLLQSGDLDKDFSRSTKMIGNNKAKVRALNKINQSRKKSQKSISSTQLHSMKSADKKSFSFHKDNITLIVKSKSPQPSFKYLPAKRQKSNTKKSAIKLIRR